MASALDVTRLAGRLAVGMLAIVAACGSQHADRADGRDTGRSEQRNGGATAAADSPISAAARVDPLDTTRRAAERGPLAAGPIPDSGSTRDDFGAPIVLAPPARRIVSLNPTTTEILFALGAGTRVVGRSRWDTWPAAALRVPEAGDAIRPSVERILALRPDLVVLYASADNRAAATSLGSAGLRVVALRVDRIADFDRATRLLGALSGTPEAARLVADSVARSLDAVRRSIPAARRRPTVFLHVWDNPLMTIGGGSFMSELVEIAGGRNVYADLREPSATISFEDLLRRSPDIVFAGPGVVTRLSSDARWQGLAAVRDGRVLAYDTSLVARPSVRLGEAARSIAVLLQNAHRTAR